MTVSPALHTSCFCLLLVRAARCDNHAVGDDTAF